MLVILLQQARDAVLRSYLLPAPKSRKLLRDDYDDPIISIRVPTEISCCFAIDRVDPSSITRIIIVILH